VTPGDGSTFGATPVQVRFQATDLSILSPGSGKAVTVTATTTTTTTATTVANKSNSNARVAIGVGVSLGLLLLCALIVIILLVRRCFALKRGYSIPTAELNRQSGYEVEASNNGMRIFEMGGVETR
jgi:hypothetical protein